MELTEAAKRISETIAGVPDLGSNSNVKYSNTNQTVASELSLSPNEIYTVTISGASNTNVRLQQIQVRFRKENQLRPRIAIGVCTIADFNSTSYSKSASAVIQNYSDIDAVIYMSKTLSGEWDAELGYVRSGATITDSLESIWPQLNLNEVGTRRSTTPAISNMLDLSIDAEKTMRLLGKFKNVVIEGVPGVGKTYVVNEIKNNWAEYFDRELSPVEIQVMHPSVAYEDFIEGLRPNAVTGSFGPQNGRLANLVEMAVAQPDKDFLLLLDEMNRANLPKVFGESLLLLDHTKRANFQNGVWEKQTDGVVRLSYTGREFFMPNNLYVLGTMNTSDRSVSNLDSALRRRFRFIRFSPDPGVVWTKHAECDETVQRLADSVIMLWANLNENILKPVAGLDSLIGHSFVLDLLKDSYGLDQNQINEAILDGLIFSIIPQVINNLYSVGLEDVLLNGGREGLPAEVIQALEDFDNQLHLLGVTITSYGSGLARTLQPERISL